MRLQFETVDVFTTARFSGNPLAVITNAEGLSAQQMQAIAAEFNLSETTFVLSPTDPANTAAVRIFTPRAEMPFAGHPNIGTAFVLARAGTSYGEPVQGDTIVFEEQAGLVPISLIKDGAAVSGAELRAPEPLSVGENIVVDRVASACGLSPGDIETTHHEPCIASCGASLMFAEVKTPAALAAAAPNPDAYKRFFADSPAVGIHLYTQVTEPEIDIRARMFAPLHNIPEDPATGAANVALIGLLAKLRPEPDLVLAKKIVQGVEMGRPSQLAARAEKRDGIVTATYIGGNCVPVMSGTIDF